MPGEHSMSKYYFAFDVETTGQFLDKNAMVAFGCTVMDQEMHEVDSFSAFMSIPKGKVWEDRCVSEFWSKNQEALEYIKGKMTDAREEMQRFVEWMDAIDLKYETNMVVLTDNPSYDVAWLNHYIGLYTDRHCLYYMLAPKDKWENGERCYWFRRIVDTNAVYNGALTIMNPHTEHVWGLEDKLEIQNTKWENDHDPLNDARNIAANYILFLRKTKAQIKESKLSPNIYGWLNVVGIVLSSWVLGVSILKMFK